MPPGLENLKCSLCGHWIHEQQIEQATLFRRLAGGSIRCYSVSLAPQPWPGAWPAGAFDDAAAVCEQCRQALQRAS